jgi:predicted TIM-barrel fold metal-dependent hydrolase
MKPLAPSYTRADAAMLLQASGGPGPRPPPRPAAPAARGAGAPPARVVLGSDYPFEMGDPDPVGAVERTPGLEDAERGAILEGNVRDLLDSMGS